MFAVSSLASQDSGLPSYPPCFMSSVSDEPSLFQLNVPDLGAAGLPLWAFDFKDDYQVARLLILMDGIGFRGTCPVAEGPFPGSDFAE